MSEQKPNIDQILQHDSDGILEYDNDLPKWWVYLFIFTIAWSGVYVIYAHFMGQPSPTVQLQAEVTKMHKDGPSDGGQTPESSTPTNWAMLMQDAQVRKLGNDVFQSKCAACHLPDGGGLVGPNLTDRYWIHGGTPDGIVKVITQGVPEKGMISWKALLKRDEILAVATHILSLKDTKPAKPKAAQGTLQQ